MTPEEWKRVKALTLEAWARAGEERAQFIARACGRDDGLHREVSTLIGAMEVAPDQFELPAPLNSPSDLPFDPGSRSHAGAYEILAPIGAGGMGTVYKARDPRLDRIVAIKMLPAAGGDDVTRRERLEREARAIAALNHPNICTVHDIGREDGCDFLVMEFLDGETLAARCARGPLPVDEAVAYAQQVGSALAAAHRAGIVHRDVKPANIILIPSPQGPGPPSAKLLDFGIAKAGALAPAEFSGPSAGGAALNDPTSIFGTVHYTAPEQCDGRATDGRTDIFAFGAVLFEMLTGRRAFPGQDRATVLAAVRQAEVPPPSSLRPEIPAACDRIVLKCLAKDPGARYQSIDEVLGDLRMLQRPTRAAALWRLVPTAALLIVLVGAGAWAFLATPRSTAPITPSVTRLTASAGVVGAAALSPDGSSVAFSSTGDGFTNPELVLLHIGSSSWSRLTNDPGVEEWPTWSPDGTQIAFIRCGAGRCGVFARAAQNPGERKLLDLPNDRYHGLSWTPDGNALVYAQRDSSSHPYRLFLLTLSTGQSRPLARAGTGIGELRFAVSPDGSMVAAIRGQDNGLDVHLVAVASGVERLLLSGQQEWFGGVAWGADGTDLILSANQNGVRRLWRLPVTGGPLQRLTIAGEDAYFPSVSAQASRLAFVREFRDWDLSRVPLSAGEARPAELVASSNRLDLDPAFSPDSRRLAFVSERSGSREVWVSDVDGRNTMQLTSLTGPTAGRPSWSPDGEHLAFHANGIHVMPARGGAAHRVADDGEMPVWSADGQSIYFVRNRSGRFFVWKVRAAGGQAVQAIASEATAAREAPNGDDLYFVKVDGGIWRQPTAGGEERLVIREFAASFPGFWTVFDDGIYYMVREPLSESTFIHHVRFLNFASNRSVDLGAVAGNQDHWVGTMTVSRDRQTLIYSQRTYQSSEIVLVEPFR